MKWGENCHHQKNQVLIFHVKLVQIIFINKNARVPRVRVLISKGITVFLLILSELNLDNTMENRGISFSLESNNFWVLL